MDSDWLNASATATMDENTILFCYEEYTWEKCLQIAVVYNKIITYVFSALAFIANVLHVIILCRMNRQTMKSYLLVIVHLSVADGLTSVFGLIRGNCYTLWAIYGQKQPIGLVLSAVFELPGTARFFIVAMLTYERFIAICMPFRYPSSIVATKTTVMAIALWVTCAISLGIRELIFAESVCINKIFGVTTEESIYSQIYLLIFKGLPLVAACIFSILMAVELRKINQRETSAEAKTVAIYTIVNTVLFIVCLTPVTISGFQPSFLLASISYMLFLLYGTLNTVIYGWMMRSYRAEVFLLCCGGCKTSQPMTRTSEQREVGPKQFQRQESNATSISSLPDMNPVSSSQTAL